MLNLDHFYSKFITQKYGCSNLSLKYMEQWFVSIKVNADRDPRIDLFHRFLGISAKNALSWSVFNFYLKLVRASNLKVHYIYSNIDPSEIKINYQKVVHGYRDLIINTNAFNRRNIFSQLRSSCQIITKNTVIARDLTFNMFETYRYTVEKLLRSNKYRSFSDLLNELYDQHTK